MLPDATRRAEPASTSAFGRSNISQQGERRRSAPDNRQVQRTFWTSKREEVLLLSKRETTEGGREGGRITEAEELISAETAVQ